MPDISVRVGQQNAINVIASSSGAQGVQGTQGLQGLQGVQGLQGIIGPVGSNAGRNFYFIKQSSNVGGYNKATEYPSTSGLSSTTVQLTETNVPVLIDSFITEPNSPGVLSIPVGENLITIHTKIAGYNYLSTYTVQYNLIISKCNFDGTGITTVTSSTSELFSNTNLTEYTWNITNQNAVVVNITDRLIFQLYVTRIDSIDNSNLSVEVDYGDGQQSYIKTTISAGAIGPQGTQGLQGLQGIQGTQGLQGLTGPIAGSNSQVIFNNNNVSAGATNFVYIASSQNVGIGTTAPAVSLDVIGSIKGTITSGTVQVSTAGTAINFTGIPSWVKRITVGINTVQTSSTSPPLIQIGSSSLGYTNTGYTGSNSVISNASAVTVNFTTGVGIGVNVSNWSSVQIVSGTVTFMLVDSTNNVWSASGIVASSNSSVIWWTAGAKRLGATNTLDRIRVTMSNGTDTFTGGSINILYEG